MTVEDAKRRNPQKRNHQACHSFAKLTSRPTNFDDGFVHLQQQPRHLSRRLTRLVAGHCGRPGRAILHRQALMTSTLALGATFSSRARVPRALTRLGDAGVTRVASSRVPIRIANAGMKVAVTGAGGRTGSLVMKLLSERSSDFAPPRGLVRTSKSAVKVRGVVDYPDSVELVVGDISNDADLAELVRGVDALVILTSAVPKPKVLSIFKAIVSKVLPWMENRRPGSISAAVPPTGGLALAKGADRRRRRRRRQEGGPRLLHGRHADR